MIQCYVTLFFSIAWLLGKRNENSAHFYKKIHTDAAFRDPTPNPLEPGPVWWYNDRK